MPSMGATHPDKDQARKGECSRTGERGQAKATRGVLKPHLCKKLHTSRCCMQMQPSEDTQQTAAAEASSGAWNVMEDG